MDRCGPRRVEGPPRSRYPGLDPIVGGIARALRRGHVSAEWWPGDVYEWIVYALGVCRAPLPGCPGEWSLEDLGYYRVPCEPRLCTAGDPLGVADACRPTPLVRLRLPQGYPEVWAKLEWYNPFSLSIKDRTALELLRWALRESRPRGLVEVSSSNTGIALAALARILGMEAVILLPRSAPVENERVLRLLGAETLRGEAPRTTELLEDAARIAAERGLVVPNQFDNDANLYAHTRGTAREIIAQLRAAGRRPTAVVAATGTSGTIGGLMLVLGNYYEGVRFYAAAPHMGEIIEGARPPETGAKWLDRVGVEYSLVRVTRREALEGMALTAGWSGLLPGVSGGSVMAAVSRLVEEGELGPGDTVVVVFPDTGFKYPAAVREALEGPGKDWGRV